MARLRRRYPFDSPPLPKSELMARLRAASTVDEIVEALWELGRGRRGGAEELAYLVDHPDAEVRETLDVTLRAYRGRAARRLRSRILLPDDAD